MKIGILADIHEANARLRLAISCLYAEGVDRFVVLGDIFETGRQVQTTVELLSRIDAIGVFGNHELGLSVDPEAGIRQRYGKRIVDFFTALHGQYELADCLFSHAQAWMDPTDLDQPWYCHGMPETADLIARNFAATKQRVVFLAHYHRWLAATSEGMLAWRGEAPLHVQKGCRYLVVIHAVCDGWCAMYDTETCRLYPMRVDERTNASTLT